METQTPVQPAPKKSNLPMILGIGAAVLVCCCVLALVILYVLNTTNSTVGNVFSQINIETPVVPDIPTLSGQEPGSGDLPQGGLTDNLLRSNTWTMVQVLASVKGCTNPSASNTTIEVSQTADSNGIWKELWTVA